ncbi:hypothetical protein A1OQ_02755 [Enterovibrio norvegicus FF-162]|uniref:AlgX/AlgJ SGNH hydrolase-like domain-containing protein n=1 Tax=Enterovibrio norvegicus FF-454 TaxID=1185651 RepID=A0A1E5C1J1_9GAMM|nr:hypothetical protein [Enterovibrio norvegicus]OEE59386.1 hypothetical protein A1OK_14080 [Enterovibrio norvegicus FF-454]OEE86782.1 hypothetical protein A1OQ_02755 [Enterovibrio norvegicus FF-162]
MDRYIQTTSALLVAVFVVVITFWNAKELNWDTEQHPILNGTQARELESQFEQSVVISDWAKGLWAAIDYSLFKEGYSGVVVGSEGWLFSAEEYFVPEKKHAKLESNLLFVTNISKQFQASGITLKVALIPEKAEIYAEYAPIQPLRRQGLREEIYATLRQGNLDVIDLFETLKALKHEQQLFLKTDTHWTPYGAKAAANIIAQTLPQYDVVDFNTTASKPTTFRGDLLNFIPVAPYFNNFGPTPDTLVAYSTEPSALEDEDLLFAPIAEPSIALIGTSYSANTNWNFPGFLRDAAKQEVLDLSTEGQGPFTPMEDFILDSDFNNNNIKTVIWEIPIRYFESNNFYAKSQGNG